LFEFFFEEFFKFKYAKANKGEQFVGLDLITKLLTPANIASSATKNTPLIEELGSVKDNILNETSKIKLIIKIYSFKSIDNASGENEQCEDEEDDEDGDIWYVDQKVGNNAENDSEIKLNNLEIKYGFAQTKSNVFSKLSVTRIFLFLIEIGLIF
jgi:hypothetical protein